MANCTDPEILAHLLTKKSFDRFLKKTFRDPDEYKVVFKSINKKHKLPAQFLDEYEIAFYEHFKNHGKSIISFAWDSNGWGPGGNGSYEIVTMWGLVLAYGSDHDLEFGFELENNWHPFPQDPSYIPTGTIDLLGCDVEMISSSLFSDEALLAMALERGATPEIELYINGEQIDWDEIDKAKSEGE